jgi:very-short-patch-repair endonuclease
MRAFAGAESVTSLRSLRIGDFGLAVGRYHQPMRVPSPGALVRAKRLRRISTPAEEALWEHLRDRKLLGLKFRRQVPVGPYVADFYCYELRLILELDGLVHEGDSQIRHDVNRDGNPEALGFRILRFTNREVHAHLESVLETIRGLYQRRSG